MFAKTLKLLSNGAGKRVLCATLLALALGLAPAFAQADETTESPNESEIEHARALTHYNLAQFYMRHFKFGLAEVELDQTIRSWPEMQIAHRDLCLACLMHGQPLRALAELTIICGLGEPIPLNDAEVAALNKKSAKLHYIRAIEYGTQRNWQEEITECRWALTYAPTNAAIHHSLAFAYGNLGDFDKAEGEYTSSSELDPKDPYAHADFAWLLEDAGARKRAMDEMAQAVKLAPNAAALHVDLGWMAEAKGDLLGAESEFAQAIKLSPNHAALWAHLGKIQAKEGKSKEAREAFEHALTLDPKQDDAKAGLENLKNDNRDEPTNQSPDKISVVQH